MYSINRINRLPEYLRHTIYGQIVEKHLGSRLIPDWVANALVYNSDEMVDTEDDEFPANLSSTDSQMALPTSWDVIDKQDIRQMGRTVRISEDIPDNREIYLQTTNCIPESCGTFYYEVTFDAQPNPSMIGMSLETPNRPISLMGTQNTCWVYFSDDGKVMADSGSCHQFGPTFAQGDTIGCGVNYDSKSIFYTKNGFRINTAFKDLPTLELFPFIAVRAGTVFTSNFGQEDFKFDIVEHVLQEKAKLYNEIDQVDLSNRLGTDFQGQDPVLQLVCNYLEHMCYYKSSSAIKRELNQQQQQISEDALLRSKISTLIMNGEFKQALEILEEHYPSVLDESLLFDFDIQIMAKHIRDEDLTTAIEIGKSLKSRCPQDDQDRTHQLKLLFGTLAYSRQDGGAPYETDLYGPQALNELSTRVVGSILELQGIQGIVHLPRLIKQMSELVETKVEMGLQGGGHINVFRDLM